MIFAGRRDTPPDAGEVSRMVASVVAPALR
jgi:hypothetical protein